MCVINNQAAPVVEARKGISRPHDNDVLLGRGGTINIHPGNETFRKVVDSKKRFYLTAQSKKEKRLITDSVLSKIRELEPPGQFLAKDSSTGLWHDVGYDKARNKTSQALRENAPSIRMEIAVENVALHAELKDARRTAERYYDPHYGQQQQHHQYHGTIYHSKSEYIKHFNAYNAHRYKTPEVTSLSNPDTTTHDENLSQYKYNSMHHNGKGYERSQNRLPFNHYKGSRHQFPSNQHNHIEKEMELKKEIGTCASASTPTRTFDCSMSVCWNEMTEIARNFWNSTDANMTPTSNKSDAVSHSSGEERQEFVKPPIYCDDEDSKQKIMQNRARVTTSGYYAEEFMISSKRHLVDRDNDSLKLLQTMEIEDFSVGQESNGSVGGRSLVHVFDDDSVGGRSELKLPLNYEAINREISEMSI